MKNIMITAALSLSFVAASSAAFADAHVEPLDTTCAAFEAMDQLDQQVMLPEIVTLSGDADTELGLGDISLLCNGNDEMTIGEVLEARD